MSVESSGESFDYNGKALWQEVDEILEAKRSKLSRFENATILNLFAANESAQTSEFSSMIAEARCLPFGGKTIHGPRYARIAATLQSTAEILQGRGYTPEHIFGYGYKPPHVLKDYREMNGNERGWLEAVQKQRNRDLSRPALSEFIREQDDTTVGFTETPFRYQGEHSRFRSTQTCLNACYRMVYEAITGEMLSEGSVNAAVYDHYGSHLIDDEILLNTFFTSVFKNKTKQRVNVWSVTGATIKSLAEYKERILQKFPDKQIYVMLTLASESTEDIWHTNILLEAGKDVAVCHDPRECSPRASRVLPRQIFEHRWALAFNRAHVIISDPRRD